MKFDLRILGLVVCAISIGFLVYYAVVIFTALPEYNYHDYSGLRIPNGLILVTGFITFIGFLLIINGNKRKNKDSK